MAILDHTLPLQFKTPDMMGMLDRGSQIAQFYTQNKTDSELNRLYKETNGDLNKMLEIGKTSPMARFVMPQLQAQLQAQQKAALDKQKTESEIYKNMGSGGKDYADAGEINQKTAAAKLLQAKQAVFAGAANGDPEIIRMGLNGAKATGALDEQTYTQFIQQLDSLGKDPVKISEWAKGAILAGSQNPASFVFQTKDNEADNAQSEKNSIRTNETQRYGIKTTAETADENRAVQVKRLEFDQQQAYFQKNKPVGFGVDVNGRKYAIMPDGNSRYIKDENGNYVIEQVKGGSGSGLTEQQSKDALFGSRMQESHKILTDLEGEGVSNTWVSRLPMIGDGYSQVMPSVLGGANSKQQQYAQAQRDFINAVLRKESGAAIGDSEFENAQKQYFPQIGDSKDVIAQKAKNRELAMKMIVNGSGVQGKTLINSTTNSQNQLQPGQVPSAGAGGSALSLYK